MASTADAGIGRELVFALDTDEAGQTGFRELAPVARLRGKRVAYLERDAYGGEKDAAAWAAGVLCLGAWPETPTPEPPIPDAPYPAPTVPATGDPWDDWERASGEPLDIVEQLHPSVRLDGFRLTVAALDNRTRHAVMCAIAGHHRLDVRMIPTRHDYHRGSLTFSPSGHDLASTLALLVSRELKNLDAEQASEAA